MYKRVLACLLAVFIAVSGVPPQVAYAVRNDYSIYHEDFKRALCERCNNFQQYLGNAGSKQYGLLFRLRILSQYMMYTHFIISKRKGLGSQSEAQTYEQDLSKQIDTFNKLFSKKSEDFLKCKLNGDFTGVNDGKNNHFKVSKEALENNVCDVIPKYLEELLKDIQDDITEAGGDTKKVDEVKERNTTLLKNIYEVKEAVLSARSDLTAYRPYDENGKRLSYGMKSSSGKGVVDIYNELAKKYVDLFDIGRVALNNEETDEEITVDLTKPYVDNLSDAVTVSGTVGIPESPSLSMLYHAIMAASAVYVPLQSYAGSSEFQSALKSLTNDDQVQAEIIEFYSAVKDIRKPLYKREFDDSKNPTGTAKLLSINDFINDVRNGNSGVLCTVLGKFCADAASNTWVYQQKDFRNTSEYEYDESEDNSQASIEENDDDEVDTSVGGSVTVGGTPTPAVSASPTATPAPTTSLLPGATVAPTTTVLPPVGSVLGRIDSWFTVRAKASSVSGTADPSSGADPSSSANTSSSADPSSGADPGSEEQDATINDTAVFAYTEITDATKLSEPVYMYGSDYFRDVDNMTYVLFQNAVCSSSNLQRLPNKDTRYLFVNPFGDIVTEDNLIVFPGVANPLIYKSSESYNPYTAAFMNTYPTIYKKNASFKLVNKNDIGKFIIVKQSGKDSGVAKDFYAVKTSSIRSIKDSEPVRVRKLYRYFSVDGDSKNELLKYNRLIFGSSLHWNEDNDAYFYTPLTNDVSATAEGVTIFPYIAAEDAGFVAANAIAKNMFLYLTRDSKGKAGNVHQYNENYILHYFILNGLDGTNNPKGFSRNSLEQYERFVKGTPERFLDSVKGMTQSILDFTGSTQGVLGLQESMQSPVLGRVLTVCRTNLPYFVLVVSLILLYTFAKMKASLLQASFKWLFSITVAYLCITLVPTYVPMVFNIAINEISENLTYKVLGLKSEGEVTEITEAELDADGEEKLTTGSLTLYRSGTMGYDDFVSMVNASGFDISGGNIRIINSGAGIYVEGDSIKINTSKLFDNLRIAKDSSDDSVVNSLYQLKAYKTVSDNVDYYTPFYQIVDSFVKELNMFEQVYEVPRGTIIYSNGIIKDNFLVYSFANSSVFISPGKYREGANFEGLSEVAIAELENNYKSLAKELKSTFGKESEATDFLRLHEWLYKPSAAMKKTLWYNTMVANKYYDKSGKPSKERLDKLISHVNYQTKRFIYSMDDMIGKISDDTLIKLIALRAAIDFNQQVSDFGHWVYPFSINYGDLTLKDIAGCIFVNDYSKYTALDLDIVEYVGETGGWFNLIILSVLLVLLFLVSHVVQILVPVMYLLLCIVLTVKLIAQGDAKSPVKGFAKCTGLIMAGFTLFTVGIVITEKLNGSALGLYVQLFICLLMLYTLFTVISSLVGNLADLGNETVMAKFLPSGFGGFHLSVSSLTAGRLSSKGGSRRGSGYRTGVKNRSYDKYRYDASVHDMCGRHSRYGYGGYGYGGYGGGYGYRSRSGYGQSGYRSRSGYGQSSYGPTGYRNQDNTASESTNKDEFDYDKIYDTLDFEEASEEYSDLSDE